MIGDDVPDDPTRSPAGSADRPSPGPNPTALQVTEAEIVKALGHPLRLEVAQRLGTGAMSVAALIEETDTAPSTMSTHLAVLRRAGIVTSQRLDGTVVYCLSDDSVRDLLYAIRQCLYEIALRSRSMAEALRDTR